VIKVWKYRHSAKDNPKSGYDWSATGQCQTAFCVCQWEHWECRIPTLCSVRKTIQKLTDWIARSRVKLAFNDWLYTE